ncbi:MAG TPA: aldo/keto reductase [Phototrophicaceae bacterium]|nr:aldo/keto reductase [Phototrophicaceae bacterium]
MLYRKLGNSGLIVSALSLGTMQFGKAMNVGSLDQQATNEMIKFALDRGINFIDTADVYSRGESETQVGIAIKGIREELVLATKVRLPMSDTNFNRSGATRVNIMRGVESSLRRLQTDYIDLYQVHGWDSNTPLEETLRTLDDLVRQGKVRHIGLSNYMAWQAATALGIQQELGLEKFVTAQMYYSLVGRDLEHDWLAFADYTGMGILVWSTLAGGFLSGKYNRGNPPPAATRFAEAGQFVPFDLERGYKIIDALRAVANRHDVSPARVALAWTLSRPAISSVIIAARTLPHLEDNILAADLKLTEDDFKALNAVSDPGTPYPKWMVLQLDQAEDPRPKVLEPERFADDTPWHDLRGTPFKG